MVPKQFFIRAIFRSLFRQDHRYYQDGSRASIDRPWHQKQRGGRYLVVKHGLKRGEKNPGPKYAAKVIKGTRIQRRPEREIGDNMESVRRGEGL
jgi:hypothetical protein